MFFLTQKIKKKSFPNFFFEGTQCSARPASHKKRTVHLRLHRAFGRAVVPYEMATQEVLSTRRQDYGAAVVPAKRVDL